MIEEPIMPRLSTAFRYMAAKDRAIAYFGVSEIVEASYIADDLAGGWSEQDMCNIAEFLVSICQPQIREPLTRHRQYPHQDFPHVFWSQDVIYTVTETGETFRTKYEADIVNDRLRIIKASMTEPQ